MESSIPIPDRLNHDWGASITTTTNVVTQQVGLAAIMSKSINPVEGVHGLGDEAKKTRKTNEITQFRRCPGEILKVSKKVSNRRKSISKLKHSVFPSNLIELSSTKKPPARGVLDDDATEEENSSANEEVEESEGGNSSPERNGKKHEKKHKREKKEHVYLTPAELDIIADEKKKNPDASVSVIAHKIVARTKLSFEKVKARL